MPSVSLPLIDVPAQLAVAANKVNTYRGLVAAALAAGSAPEPLDIRLLPRETFFLPPGLHAKVQAAATAANMTFQQAFAGLTQAGLNLAAVRRADQETRSAVALPPPFTGATPEQTTFYKHISASLDVGRICVAEASTGVGKGRAMIMAGLRQAEKKKTPVVITAPTLKILGQLWEEMEILRAQGLGISVKAAFYPGITEFVDADRLRDFLQESTVEDDGVAEWVAQGGPVLHDTSLTRALRGAGRPLSFLMEDLRQIATHLPPADFAVREGEAHEAIALVRAYAQDADLLFCTHAMMGRAYQTGWAAFPKPQVLIVDEAHQFEQQIATVFSQQLSLSSLRYHIQAVRGTNARKAVVAIDALMKRLRGLDVPEGNGMNRITAEHADTLLEAFRNCADTLKGRGLRDVERIAEARDVLSDGIDVLSGKPGRAYVSFSPDWRFPSLLVGRATVGGLLGDIWRSATGGAVVASATLYLPDEFGNRKCDYIMDVLALPPSRMDTPLPVVARWVTSIPVMHTPNPDLAARLSRPLRTKRDKVSEDQWMDNLALTLRQITEGSLGGTLVLASSFAQAQGLADRLDMPDRVVCQGRSQKFAVVEEQFRERHAEGRRPVLIGVGTAWTGVDLRDKSVPAQEDRLLTDLVVACCPIGLNQTSTMLARIERTSIKPIVSEGLMILRQGLGRLIRHPDVCNRHIWMLDGRIWGPWPGMEKFTRAASFLVNGYAQRESF